MSTSFIRSVYRDIAAYQKTTDVRVPVGHSFAVNLDISRVKCTWDDIHNLCRVLYLDKQRSPTLVYVCTSTLILAFNSDPHNDQFLFQGSCQTIVSWFCGVVGLHLGIKSTDEIVLGKLTEFSTASQLTEYILWACHVHEQSTLNHTILEFNPSTDPRGLLNRELEELIPKDKLSDPTWLDHRYGRMIQWIPKTNGVRIIHGPFRGDRYNEVREWLTK